MTRPLIILTLYSTISTILGITIHPSFFMLFILSFTFILIDVISSDFITSNLIFGIFQLGRIKRVHTQYGRFYIIIKDNNIKLLQDKIFWLKYINYTNYNGVDSVRSWVKCEYDTIYQTKIAKAEIMNQLKGWNGCIDLQTERDKKLDKIL